MDLANQAGISVSFLSLVERGKREPTLSVLRKIAAALDMPFGLVLAAALATPGDTESHPHQVAAIEKLVEAVRVELLAQVVESRQINLLQSS